MTPQELRQSLAPRRTYRRFTPQPVPGAALADLLEGGKLFDSGEKTAWMCLNCGEIVTASLAPNQCPVCDHERGYFIRLELAPSTRG